MTWTWQPDPVHPEVSSYAPAADGRYLSVTASGDGNRGDITNGFGFYASICANPETSGRARGWAETDSSGRAFHYWARTETSARMAAETAAAELGMVPA